MRCPRLAHWLKYHYRVEKTFTIRLRLPGWLWNWADRRMDRYYDER